MLVPRRCLLVVDDDVSMIACMIGVVSNHCRYATTKPLIDVGATADDVVDVVDGGGGNDTAIAIDIDGVGDDDDVASVSLMSEGVAGSIIALGYS